MLLGTVGCDTESTYTEPQTIRLRNSHFPLRPGAEYRYAYDSIVYRDFEQVVDTVSGELRVRYTDTFRQPNGKVAYRILREFRPADSLPWQAHSTWSAWRDSAEVIVQEGNVPLVKLRYPLENGKRWDGNRYHSLGQGGGIDKLIYEGTYEIIRFQPQLTLEGQTYDSVYTVRQVRDSTSVFSFRHIEMYARGVGLIRRFRKDSISDRVEFPRGQIIQQRLLRYTP